MGLADVLHIPEWLVDGMWSCSLQEHLIISRYQISIKQRYVYSSSLFIQLCCRLISCKNCTTCVYYYYYYSRLYNLLGPLLNGPKCALPFFRMALIMYARGVKVQIRAVQNRAVQNRADKVSSVFQFNRCR